MSGEKMRLPGPPLRGWAIRLVADRPEHSQKKGFYLDMPVNGTGEAQEIAFTAALQRIFPTEEEAKDTQRQIKSQLHIETEIIHLA